MTTLIQNLVSILHGRFSHGTFAVSSEGGTKVVFPAVHPEVGNIEVLDDGDELTVYLGNFTHLHFEGDDEGPSEAQGGEKIAEEVAEFLEAVLADRIEFYGSSPGGGGCRPRQEKKRGWLSRLLLGRRTYVWSGPLDE